MTSARPFKSAAARELYLARYALRAKAWPVPSEERAVPGSFGQTFVRISGPRDAPPLLLLPGIGSTGLSLASLVAELSTQRRTFVIDNIHDVGRSVETKPVTSADDFTTWLEEVRLGLGLGPGPVDVLGLSYGGWISAQYALRFPSSVRRVVLLAPAGTTASIPFGFIWRAVLCALPFRAFMRGFMGWVAPELKAQRAAVLEEMVEDGYLATRSFASRRMVPPLPLSDEQWRSFTRPTLFLAGDREVIFPPHEAVEKLARVAPAIETALLPGVGHDFFVVRAEEVNRRVLEFLSRV